MTSIAFEDYVEKPKKKGFGLFENKKKIKQEEVVNNLNDNNDDELIKLQKEFEEKKKLIEIKKLEEKIKENEKILQIEKLKKLEQDKLYEEEVKEKEQLINFDFKDMKNIKRCPKCNQKLFNNKVVQIGEHLSQVLKCKNPKCDFFKELKYNI